MPPELLAVIISAPVALAVSGFRVWRRYRAATRLDIDYAAMVRAAFGGGGLDHTGHTVIWRRGRGGAR